METQLSVNDLRTQLVKLEELKIMLCDVAHNEISEAIVKVKRAINEKTGTIHHKV